MEPRVKKSRKRAFGVNEDEEDSHSAEDRKEVVWGFELEVPSKGLSVELASEESVEAWKSILETARNEIRAFKQVMTRKRRKCGPNKSFIVAVESRASESGFSDEELGVIWKVATHPNAKYKVTERIRLVFSMVPQFKVGSNIVESIIWWLWTARENGVKPTVLLSVYKLLNFYTENCLAEEGAISNPNAVSRILQTPTENIVIPWKMNLFRNIITPFILEKSHIFHLRKMLNTKNAKKTHIDDINASIGICRHMRPDLFEEGGDETTFDGKLRFFDYPKNVSNVFFSCKQRISSLSQIEEYSHPYADKIFPEFLPLLPPSSGPYARFSRFDAMLKLLVTDDGVIELAFCAPLLHVFTEWFECMVHYRFHSYLGVCSVADARRYEFIFDRCFKLMNARQDGLDTVSNWLVEFLTVWDFTMFEEHIYLMFQFVRQRSALPYWSHISDVLVDRFSNCSWTRLGIWKSLTTMKDFWLNEASTEGVTFLLDTMEECVTQLVVGPEFGDDPELILKMCLSYKDLCYKSHSVDDPLLKSKMQKFPSALTACVALLQNIQCLEIMCEAMSDCGYARFDAMSLIDGPVFYGLTSCVETNFLPELTAVAKYDFQSLRASIEGIPSNARHPIVQDFLESSPDCSTVD